MTVAAARGRLSRLAVGPSGSAATYRLGFAGFNHGCTGELLNTNDEVSVGTLTQPVERVVANRVMVRPAARLSPSLADLRLLLPWMFYGAEAGTGPYTYPLGDAPPKKQVAFLNDAAKFFDMTGVGVDRGVLRARTGGSLECELGLVGLTYATAGTFPALAANVAPPLLFKTAAVTVNGVTTYCTDIEIEVAHGIDAERFLNSPTLPDLVNMRREVKVTMTLPVGQHAALWDAAMAGAGVPVTATFTAPGGGTALFAFPAVKASAEGWDTPGSGESFFRWAGQAFGSAGGPGNDEVAATITLPA